MSKSVRQRDDLPADLETLEIGDPGGAAPVTGGNRSTCRRAEPRPLPLALLVALPYLVLALAWTFSNPAGAAPDEPDHLVKALGTAQLDVGIEASPAPSGATPVEERNASITRIYTVPSRLSAAGFTCFAFRPEISAACLPDQRPADVGDVATPTPIGDYPPFLYAPIGWAAQLGRSPTQAILLGRLVTVGMSWVLIVMACWHLAAWVGRRALLGVVWALTPMAVFATAIISTSGVEIAAACCVAAVVASAIHRPESIEQASTQWTMAIAGTALVLSRHLGAVTLLLLLVILVGNLGWRRLWAVIRRPSPSLIAMFGAIGVSLAAMVWWELSYDTAARLGSVLEPSALEPFVGIVYIPLASSVGRFGWFDTPLPNVAQALWLMLVVVAIGSALLLGSRRLVISISAALAGAALVAFATYSVVFFPLRALLQGRQILPLLVFAPIMAATMLRDEQQGDDRLFRRLTLTTAVVVTTVHLLSLVWNARRFATGLDGPIWFFGREEWSPRGGWAAWLLVGLAGAVLLAAVVLKVIGRAPRREVQAAPGERTPAEPDVFTEAPPKADPGVVGHR